MSCNCDYLLDYFYVLSLFCSFDREILKSELICEEDSVKSTAADEEISELLLHFLSSLEKQKKKMHLSFCKTSRPWRMISKRLSEDILQEHLW